MREARDLLASARDLIEDPDHFCREWYAVDEAGRYCASTDAGAVAWCAYGAIEHFQDHFDHGPRSVACRALESAAERMTDEKSIVAVVSVNDRLGHSAVLEMFETAINELESA